MSYYMKLGVLITTLIMPSQVFGDYARGCLDPKYQQYLNKRFAHFNDVNKRLLKETLFDYQNNLKNSTNPFRAISDLSRHLKYSAQLDPIDIAQKKVELLLDYGDNLRVDQQVAVSIFDNFSDENHAIGIARAWLAYRQGDAKTAFSEMLTSIENADSAVMSSFGPDIYFIRQIYQDGHTKPVLAYLEKTEAFWRGKDADNMRYIWRAMIAANCGIAFESLDAFKALELGLSVRDIRRNYLQN